MARVLIRTQAWGVVTSRAGDALASLTFAVKNTDGTAATHWSAETGGTSSTATLTTDTLGGATLSGADRWIEAGEYDVTTNGTTYRVTTSGTEFPQGIVIHASNDTTGVADKANILAAIARLPAPSGGTLFLVDTDYYLPTGTGVSWNDRRVTIAGQGRGSTGLATTVHVLAGGTAFNPQNGSSGFGAGSSIERMYLKGADVGLGSNDGILLQCNSGVVRDVDIENFGRHGIHVRSGTTGNPFVADGQFNANSWFVEHVRSAHNFASGIFTEGVDSNAGVAIGLDCSNNSGEGIYENSSYGNTYYGPQLAANTSHAIRLSGNTRSTRVYGAYKDGDSTPALLIEVGNGGGNIIDFRVLVGNAGETVVDNSAAQDNRITSQAGGMLHERFPPTTIAGSDAAWSVTAPAFFINTGASKTALLTHAKVVTTAALDQEGIAYPLGTLPAGDWSVGLYWRSNAGGELLEFVAGPAGAGGARADFAVTGVTYWTRASGKFTADGATACYAVLKTQAGHAAVTTFFVDALQVAMI